MAKFLVTIRRTVYLEALIDADSIEDAREEAQNNHGDWTDASGGRGLGDDDIQILDVEDVSDEYVDDDDDDDLEPEDDDDDTPPHNTI